MEPLLSEEGLSEYFREQVAVALKSQRIKVTEMTVFYLVNLLTQFAVADKPGYHLELSAPFAFRFCRAMGMRGQESLRAYRSLGDTALFVTGFFPDVFRHRSIDISYYVSIGTLSYEKLVGEPPEQKRRDEFSLVFQQLSRQFVQFADVVADVAMRAGFLKDSDTLKLYEKWLLGSQRAGKMLVARGIPLNKNMRKALVQ